VVQITQPVEFTSVYKLENVVYSNMELKGQYMRNTETKGIIRVECEELKLAHPACEIYVIPPQCRHGLEENHMIKLLNHAILQRKTDPPAYAMLDKGGVLIQQGVENYSSRFTGYF
jgi:hypothetical protein